MNREYSTTAIGIRISEKRRSLGLTQEMLAEAANISAIYVSVLELGKKNMSAEILFDLAEALNTSTDYLLGREK